MTCGDGSGAGAHKIWLQVSEFGQLGRFTVLRSDLSQIQGRTHDCVHFLKRYSRSSWQGRCEWRHLSPGARGGDPQVDRVDGDAHHAAARHEVADSVGPPGVVVALVDDVFPGYQLKIEAFKNYTLQYDFNYILN